MLTANIVQIAMWITFDEHIVQSCLDLPKLEKVLLHTLEDSDVMVENLSLDRYSDLIPDTGKSAILMVYSGTTLRPYNSERFQGVIADHLNGIQEIVDSGTLFIPADVNIRLMYKKFEGENV